MQNRHEWTTIPIYDGLYEIMLDENNQPLIRRKDKKVILKPTINNSGYQFVVLHDKDKNQHMLTLHKAVALTFVPNPNNYPIINHKDENKLNCSPENLEWCTRKYNNAYNNLHEKINNKILNTYGKEVWIYNFNGELVYHDIGTRKCVRELNLGSSGNFSSTLSFNDKNPDKLRQYKGYLPFLKEMKKEDILELIQKNKLKNNSKNT